MRANYHRDELWDWAEAGGNKVYLGSSGELTGVVVPFDIQAGAILEPVSARRLAAQLLLMADLHDDIFDRGFNESQELIKLELAHKNSILKEIYYRLHILDSTEAKEVCEKIKSHFPGGL